MRDIPKLLYQNGTAFISSSDDESQSDSESPVWNGAQYSYKGNILLKLSENISTKKRNGEKRLPTRRPDPNVYNRNALLARENRRKKKMYLEGIEKELQIARKANRALSKALKRQVKITRRLEKQKQYFERLVTHRPGILKLGKAFNSDEIPELEKSNSSDISNFGDEPTTEGQSYEDLLTPEYDSRSDDNTDTSLPATTTTWDDIWGDRGYDIDNIISGNPTLLKNDNIQSINDDHSYVATSSISNIQTPDHSSEFSNYVDIEGDCAHMGTYYLGSNCSCDYGTPPLQLLSE